VTASVSIGLLSGANDMILDDSPRGELDNSLFSLGPTVTLADVTPFTRAVSIRRGRQRQLDRFQAGQCTILLDNNARTFDPSVTSSVVSPYAGEIVPRREVRVDVDGVRLFTGIVEDWNLAYGGPQGDATAEVVCADRLNLFAEQYLSASSMVVERTDQRITKVLSAPEVDWSLALRDVDVGDATLSSASVGGNVNALQYLQRVEQAEGGGGVFIDRSGSLTFVSRSSAQLAGSVVVSDSGAASVLPFSDLQVEFGTESLFNRVSVTLESSGVLVTADDPVSQSKYGITQFDIADSLLSTVAQAEDYAAFTVATFGEPVYRVNGLRLPVDRLSAAQALSALELDLLDVLTVRFTPSRVPPEVVRTVLVDRIEHTILPRSHVMSLGFSQTIAAFVLDSSVNGVLDVDILGF